MAIEIIPKEKEKLNPKKQIAFYIGVSILLISVLSSLFIYYFEWRFLQEREVLTEYIEQRRMERARSLEREIEKYSEKTTLFLRLKDSMRSSSPFFEVTEESIHPGVILTRLIVNVEQGRITASGLARNIVAFDQQVRILKGEEKIANVNVSDFVIEEGRRVSFPAIINLSNRVFENSQEE